MASKSESVGLIRFRRILGFFIGLFGALAILGVFFKIMKYDNYEIYMIAGFIGEAAAFVTMGILELISAFGSKESLGVTPSTSRELTFEGVSQEHMNAMLRERMERVADEVTSSFRAMLEETTRSFQQTLAEQSQHNIGVVMGQMAQETHRFGSEMHDFSEELEKARLSVHSMARELSSVANGSLAADAERLGSGMGTLGAEMEMAGNAVEQIRADLDQVAARFHLFNNAPSYVHADSPAASNGTQNQNTLKKL